MSDEDAERLREANRERIERGEEPISADHYRAVGDIVPLGSGEHADGVVHEMVEQDTLTGNGLLSHTNYLATPAAMRTPEGRAALPGVPVPDEQMYEYETASTNQNRGSRALELGRRGLGYLGRGVNELVHMNPVSELYDWIAD